MKLPETYFLYIKIREHRKNACWLNDNIISGIFSPYIKKILFIALF